jgi:hypothetical protein
MAESSLATMRFAKPEPSSRCPIRYPLEYCNQADSWQQKHRISAASSKIRAANPADKHAPALADAVMIAG